MSGTNIAQYRKNNRWIFESRGAEDKPCVFLSHKKEDESIAEALGNYILKNYDYNIYLDKYDLVLQEAVSKDNDEAIVNSIKDGMKYSTALLCVISDRTRLSWWVPYEVGLADDKHKYIASVKTRDIPDFPSFLKTQQTISSTAELIQWLSSIGKYGNFFTKDMVNYQQRAADSGLIKYFG